MIVRVYHTDGWFYDPFVLRRTILETEAKRVSRKVQLRRHQIAAGYAIESGDIKRELLLRKLIRKIGEFQVAKSLRDECNVPQWKALKLVRRHGMDLMERIARHRARWEARK